MGPLRIRGKIRLRRGGTRLVGRNVERHWFPGASIVAGPDLLPGVSALDCIARLKAGQRPRHGGRRLTCWPRQSRRLRPRATRSGQNHHGGKDDVAHPPFLLAARKENSTGVSPSVAATQPSLAMSTQSSRGLLLQFLQAFTTCQKRPQPLLA